MADKRKPQQAWGFAHYRVLGVLYFSYFANVFSRTAVQVSLAAMAADSSLNFTPTMTATVLSSGAGTQVAGKLLGASVMAKLGPLGTFILNHSIMFLSLTLMTAPVGGAFNFARFLAGWIGNMWAASTYAPRPPELSVVPPDCLCWPTDTAGCTRRIQHVAFDDLHHWRSL